MAVGDGSIPVTLCSVLFPGIYRGRPPLIVLIGLFGMGVVKPGGQARKPPLVPLILRGIEVKQGFTTPLCPDWTMKHMSRGTTPTSVCPTDGLQVPWRCWPSLTIDKRVSSLALGLQEGCDLLIITPALPSL